MNTNSLHVQIDQHRDETLMCILVLSFLTSPLHKLLNILVILVEGILEAIYTMRQTMRENTIRKRSSIMMIKSGATILV
jgi:hypothetical protein